MPPTVYLETSVVSYLAARRAGEVVTEALRPAIEAACRRAGFAPPVICTPDELMGR